MTANLHVLRTTAVTDRESVVRTLEKMLQHSREGNVQGVAVAWIDATGRVQGDLVRRRRRSDAGRGFISAVSPVGCAE